MGRSNVTWTKFKSSKETCRPACKSFRGPGRLIMRWHWWYVKYINIKLTTYHIFMSNWWHIIYWCWIDWWPTSYIDVELINGHTLYIVPTRGGGGSDWISRLKLTGKNYLELVKFGTKLGQIANGAVWGLLTSRTIVMMIVMIIFKRKGHQNVIIIFVRREGEKREGQEEGPTRWSQWASSSPSSPTLSSSSSWS